MDPIKEIQEAAINPSTIAAPQQRKQNETEKLKKKGLCINCGINKTHVKKKGLISSTMIPLFEDVPCYRQNLCPSCYRRKKQQQFHGSSSSSSSLRNLVGSSGSRNSSSQLPDPSLILGGQYHSWTTRDATTDTHSSAVKCYSSSPPIGIIGSGGAGPPSYVSNTSNQDKSTVGGVRRSLLPNSDIVVSKDSTGSRQSNNSPKPFNKDSHCVRFTILADSVWKVRADEAMQEPRKSLIFPQYESQLASRHTTVTVIDSFDNTISKQETMHFVQIGKNNGRPTVAYRKLSYPPPRKIPYGQSFYCMRLERVNSDSAVGRVSGFQEQALRDKWSNTVVVKEIAKQPYFGLDGHSDSPLKDAVVLQQIGNHKNGILECEEILEDKHYIYMICPMTTTRSSTPNQSQQQHGCYITLSDIGIRHPRIRNPQTHNQFQEEQYIRHIFKQLVKAVQQSHKHGLCHRNLDPQNIYLLAHDRGTSSPYSVVLSDFVCSVLVSNNNEQRYLFIPGVGGESNRRYIAPELYHHQIYDGIATDMWSLGIVLFELLTGCKLHSHPTNMDPIYCFFILNSGFLRSSGGIPDEIFDRMMPSSSKDDSSKSLSTSSSCHSNSTYVTRQMEDLMDTIEAVNQLSQYARNLLTDLLQEYPPNRLSIQEVFHHPWFYYHGHT